MQVGFSPNPMMYGRVEPRRLKDKEETPKPSLRCMTTNGHPPFREKGEVWWRHDIAGQSALQ